MYSEYQIEPIISSLLGFERNRGAHNNYSKNPMGSSNNRKKNDNVRVNRPKKQGAGGGGSSDGGGEDINVACPMTFDVSIKSSRPLPDGTSVIIRGEELFVIGESVGRLQSRQIQTITKCSEKGITYSCQILNKKDKPYARFIQNT